MKERMTITLSEMSHEALKRQRNSSGYIGAILAQQQREWRGALAFLRAEGWAPYEILGAVSTQPHLVPIIGSLGVIADGMAALPADRMAELGIEVSSWTTRITEARDPAVGRLLWCLSFEFWNGNQDLKLILGKL